MTAEALEVDMAEQGSSEGTTKRFVRAAIVSAVSGAITYGIRKLAPTVREKLQSAGDGGVPGAETLGKAKDAVEERVEAAASAVSERIGTTPSAPTRSTPALSNKQLEQRLKRRAQHRREREKALTT
jgi:hypothetical protein